MFYNKKNITLNKDKVIPVQVKAVFYFFICSFLQKSISIITTPIFTRLLNLSDYGKFNIFTSWMSVISIFVTLNLSGGVFTQGLVKNKSDANNYTASFQGISFLFIILWSFVYVIFRKFFNSLFSLTTLQMLLMFLLIWTTSIFNLWAATERVFYRYKNLLIITVLTSLLQPIISICFIFIIKDKVTARILGIVVVQCCLYIGLFFKQIKKGHIFNKKYWKYALLLGSPLILHYLSQTILNSADKVMIEKIIGSEEVAIYSLACSISQVMTLLNTVLLQTFTPWIYEKINIHELDKVKNFSYIALILVALANIILILFAPEIILIFAPKTYYNAIYIIPPLAMSVFFMFSYDLFAKFAFFYEKTNFIMCASLIGALLNVLLNYIFIPLYGYIAAGYTTLICYAVYSICHFCFMRLVCKKKCGNVQPFQINKLLLIVVIFLFSGFSILFLYEFIMIRCFILIVIILLLIFFRKKVMTVLLGLFDLDSKENYK